MYFKSKLKLFISTLPNISLILIDVSQFNKDDSNFFSGRTPYVGIPPPPLVVVILFFRLRGSFSLKKNNRKTRFFLLVVQMEAYTSILGMHTYLLLTY